MIIKTKCPCETDVHACCACVSMHCSECHGHSKFQQGEYCSHCGRPLKAELQRNYVPMAEVERLERLRAELSKEVADLQDELKCEKETNDHLCGEYLSAKAEVAREIMQEVRQALVNMVLMNAMGKTYDIEKRFAEIEKKYTGEQT